MLPFLRKHTEDMGVCLTALCPHCQRVSQFKLRRKGAALLLFGLELYTLDESYELSCCSCQFSKSIADDELSAARAAERLHQQLKAGQLPPAEYLKALDALDFPALQALRNEAATWPCPVCGEKVPATLSGCWKCSSPRPGMQKTPSSEEAGLPPLPTGLTQPRHPWEM
jgi:hypothetical protein